MFINLRHIYFEYDITISVQPVIYSCIRISLCSLIFIMLYIYLSINISLEFHFQSVSHNLCINWKYLKIIFSPTFIQLKSSIQFSVLSRWLSGKEPAYQCQRHKRHEFSSWVRKIPWGREWQPTPVLLPGKSHGQKSLESYSSLSLKDTTERLTL